jgi:hypothetical protein
VPPVVSVVRVGFFWPPPAVEVLAVVVVVVGIGEVGEGIETSVEGAAVLSWPLESEPQPASTASNAAAASATRSLVARVEFTSAGFVASPTLYRSGSGSSPSSSSTPKLFSAKASMW